eukprot:CAMPEP_0197520694 /NCGR_PEP_ID=MMETSP1318-20131121/6032_1 /TAXON_ID=552666 /ORGANISM="Partenskyella glossopodia, Strain RCC365" /LENGTH=87 /DNA_ID=CAMNT_0043072387 /DNA_START=208 /DNA_END=468 /DNA_ORIENTATION=-
MPPRKRYRAASSSSDSGVVAIQTESQTETQTQTETEIDSKQSRVLSSAAVAALLRESCEAGWATVEAQGREELEEEEEEWSRINSSA